MRKLLINKDQVAKLFTKNNTNPVTIPPSNIKLSDELITKNYVGRYGICINSDSLISPIYS